MYCILVTGIPASGKSTLAEYLGEKLNLPVFSKDCVKELLFDEIGFSSREEKVRLGTVSTEILYDTAERLMKRNKPFLLENNFENASREGLFSLLERYSYQAITVTLTGDYAAIYRRFLVRNESPERHRGHVVNDCYPEKHPGTPVAALSFEQFVSGIRLRGMDSFTTNGPHIIVDTTDFSLLDREALLRELVRCRNEILGVSAGGEDV